MPASVLWGVFVCCLRGLLGFKISGFRLSARWCGRRGNVVSGVGSGLGAIFLLSFFGTGFQVVLPDFGVVLSVPGVLKARKLMG